jgi:hypothetical protein
MKELLTFEPLTLRFDGKDARNSEEYQAIGLAGAAAMCLMEDMSDEIKRRKAIVHVLKYLVELESLYADPTRTR